MSPQYCRAVFWVNLTKEKTLRFSVQFAAYLEELKAQFLSKNSSSRIVETVEHLITRMFLSALHVISSTKHLESDHRGDP